MLTGVQLKAKNYTASQIGAVVYVTAAETIIWWYQGKPKCKHENSGNAGIMATTVALGIYIGTGD